MDSKLVDVLDSDTGLQNMGIRNQRNVKNSGLQSLEAAKRCSAPSAAGLPANAVSSSSSSLAGLAIKY